MSNNDLGPGFRTPPHNLSAEQGLLGAILVNNRAHEAVSEFLRSEHFMAPNHAKIYEVMDRMISDGQTANPITMWVHLQNEEFKKDYLVDLASNSISLINAPEYARLVFGDYQRRQVIEACHEAMSLAYDASEMSPADIVEKAAQGLDLIAEGGDLGKESRHIREVMTDAVSGIEDAAKHDEPQGLMLGLTDLDNAIGGLVGGDFVVLAARPGMGKTALANSIAYSVAQHGTPVDLYTLEMKDVKIAARALSRDTNISTMRQRHGDIKDDEWAKIAEAALNIGKLPIYIDDRTDLSVQSLRSRARRSKRKHGIGLIIVDYLQLLDSGSRYSGNRVNEVSEITRGLKKLAIELNVPVIALSQLSRAVEGRDNKRPQLSDLRESGSIEQDADIVMFIYREHLYLQKLRPVKSDKESHIDFEAKVNDWEQRLSATENEAEVDIAKSREGLTKTVHAFFDGARSYFGDKAKEQQGEMEY